MSWNFAEDACIRIRLVGVNYYLLVNGAIIIPRFINEMNLYRSHRSAGYYAIWSKNSC